MSSRVLVLAVVGSLAAAGTSAAQSREPIGRLVVDIRGSSTGLPAAEGWTPRVPAGTLVPARGLGFEAGGHVYLWRFRQVSVGAGGSWLFGQGSISPPESPGVSTTRPRVTTRLSSVAPQISLNFGHALGWSYLSGGVGRTRVNSDAVAAGDGILLGTRESGWAKTLNWGGGARWFVRERLGVGFDLRWHKLSPVPARDGSGIAPRTTLITAGVGITLK
jgi:hypothetical protein